MVQDIHASMDSNSYTIITKEYMGIYGVYLLQELSYINMAMITMSDKEIKKYFKNENSEVKYFDALTNYRTIT